MLKPKDRDGLLPAQKQLFAAMGVTRFVMRTTALALCLSVAGNVLQAVERAHIAERNGPKVYVAITDPNAEFVRLARAHADWRPGDGAWLNQASRWLHYVRSSPGTDDPNWLYQAGVIRGMTNEGLYDGVATWIEEQRKDHRDRPIQVEILQLTLEGKPSPRRAVVNVRWRERSVPPDTPPGPWKHYGGTINLAKATPKTTGEVEENLVGIQVTFYSFHPLAAGEHAEVVR